MFTATQNDGSETAVAGGGGRGSDDPARPEGAATTTTAAAAATAATTTTTVDDDAEAVARRSPWFRSDAVHAKRIAQGACRCLPHVSRSIGSVGRLFWQDGGAAAWSEEAVSEVAVLFHSLLKLASSCCRIVRRCTLGEATRSSSSSSSSSSSTRARVRARARPRTVARLTVAECEEFHRAFLPIYSVCVALLHCLQCAPPPRPPRPFPKQARARANTDTQPLCRAVLDEFGHSVRNLVAVAQKNVPNVQEG